MDNLAIKKFARKFLLQKIIQVEELNAEYLSGRHYFLITSQGGQQHLVAQFTPDDRQSFKDFINIQSLMAERQISVPEVLGIDRRNLLIIQQYIGTSSLSKFIISNGVYNNDLIKLYQQAIDLLIDMQQITGLPKYTGREFDLEKIKNEFKIFVEPYLVNNLWKNRLNSKQKKQFEEFYSHLAKILAAVPRVFCHRDFQSTNLVLDKQKKLFVIDFQGARWALPQYDLVSLLEDNYIPLPARVRTTLLNYYIQQSERTSHTKIDLKEFKENYTYTLIQRKLHDIAIFIRADVKFGDDHYLKYIPRNVKLLIKLLQKEGNLILPQ